MVASQCVSAGMGFFYKTVFAAGDVDGCASIAGGGELDYVRDHPCPGRESRVMEKRKMARNPRIAITFFHGAVP